MMGREARAEPTRTPPKLSYYSLPAQRPEPPGMATPPLRLPGAVPFLWEEAPGKPRREPGAGAGYGASVPRCLELPPRMAAEEAKETSPTTVLDGPYVLNRLNSHPSACSSFSFGDERRARKIGREFGKDGEKKKAWFWRRTKGREVAAVSPSFSSSLSSTSSSSSSSYVNGGGEREEDGEKEKEEEREGIRVKVMRIRRNRSLSNASFYPTSHLWASIKGGLKQVAPWRRN